MQMDAYKAMKDTIESPDESVPFENVLNAILSVILSATLGITLSIIMGITLCWSHYIWHYSLCQDGTAHDETSKNNGIASVVACK